MSRCTSCKGLFQNPISPPQRFSATEKNTPLRLLSFPDRFFRIFFPEGQQTLEACVIHHRNTRCATHEVCTGKHVKIISTTSKWMLGKQADFPPWVVKAYVNREKKAAYFFQGGCLTNPFQQLSSYWVVTRLEAPLFCWCFSPIIPTRINRRIDPRSMIG